MHNIVCDGKQTTVVKKVVRLLMISELKNGQLCK